MVAVTSSDSLSARVAITRLSAWWTLTVILPDNSRQRVWAASVRAYSFGTDSSGAKMVREEARRTLLQEYDRWAKDHPDDAANTGGVVFFSYLQRERSDLLDFHAVGGDKWATVHGWLYYTGRVRD